MKNLLPFFWVEVVKPRPAWFKYLATALVCLKIQHSLYSWSKFWKYTCELKSLPIAKGRLDHFTVLGDRLLRPELLTENNKLGWWSQTLAWPFGSVHFTHLPICGRFITLELINNYLESVQFASFVQAMNRWVNTSSQPTDRNILSFESR